MSDCIHIIGTIERLEEDRDWHTYMAKIGDQEYEYDENHLRVTGRYADDCRDFISMDNVYKFCPLCGEDVSELSTALRKRINEIPTFDQKHPQ